MSADGRRAGEPRDGAAQRPTDYVAASVFRALPPPPTTSFIPGAGSNTPLRERMRRAGMLARNRANAPPGFVITHTLLSGGVLSVPDAAHDEFLNELAHELDGEHTAEFNQRALRWSVSEIATPISRLYVDLDWVISTPSELAAQYPLSGGPRFVQDARACEAAVLNLATAVQAAVRRYFTEPAERDDAERQRYYEQTRFQCVVLLAADAVKRAAPSNDAAAAAATPRTSARSVCDPDREEARPVVAVKRGVHMVWPMIHVSLDDMLEIREGIVCALDRLMKWQNDTEHPWSKVVDAAVYHTSRSLRLACTVKYVECSVCKEMGSRCGSCSYGRVLAEPKGRPYKAMYVVDGNGASLGEKLIDKPRLDVLRMCTIRCPGVYERSPYFALPTTGAMAALRYSGRRVLWMWRPRPRVSSRDDVVAASSDRSAPIDACELTGTVRAPAQKRRAKSSLVAEDSRLWTVGEPFDERGSLCVVPWRASAANVVETYDAGHPWYARVERCVRAYAHCTMYRELKIVGTIEKKRYPTSSSSSTLAGDVPRFYYEVRVRGTNDQYCLNVMRPHRSRKIYFHIDTRGLAQRCRCTCPPSVVGNEARARVACSEFYSKRAPLVDIQLFEAMFARELDAERRAQRAKPGQARSTGVLSVEQTVVGVSGGGAASAGPVAATDDAASAVAAPAEHRRSASDVPSNVRSLVTMRHRLVEHARGRHHITDERERARRWMETMRAERNVKRARLDETQMDHMTGFHKRTHRENTGQSERGAAPSFDRHDDHDDDGGDRRRGRGRGRARANGGRGGRR